MEQVVIRKATLNDLDTLLAFEQGIINAERPFDPTLKTGHTNYYDIEKMIHAPDVELLVAEQDNEVIGSGYARIEHAKPYLQHQQHAYLGFMYVIPEYRGRKVIRLILEGLRDWCKTKQIHELRLEVYADNVSAINAYIKEGFSNNLIEMSLSLNKY